MKTHLCRASLQHNSTNNNNNNNTNNHHNNVNFLRATKKFFKKIYSSATLPRKTSAQTTPTLENVQKASEQMLELKSEFNVFRRRILYNYSLFRIQWRTNFHSNVRYLIRFTLLVYIYRNNLPEIYPFESTIKEITFKFSLDGLMKRILLLNYIRLFHKREFFIFSYNFQI